MTFYIQDSNYKFMRVGIQYYDPFLPDDFTSPEAILLKFLYIVERATVATAVHCKAGLSLMSCLIGVYLIKHYWTTAQETIAWLCICRPGSAAGQQQIWLEKIQNWFWRIGNQYRLQHYGEGQMISKHKYGIYSKLWPVTQEKLQSERSGRCSLKRTVSKQVIQTSSGRVINKALRHAMRLVQEDKLNEIKA